MEQLPLACLYSDVDRVHSIHPTKKQLYKLPGDKTGKQKNSPSSGQNPAPGSFLIPQDIPARGYSEWVVPYWLLCDAKIMLEYIQLLIVLNNFLKARLTLNEMLPNHTTLIPTVQT